MEQEVKTREQIRYERDKPLEDALEIKMKEQREEVTFETVKYTAPELG